MATEREMEEIHLLINQGVAFLKCLRTGEAISSLKQALETSKQLLATFSVVTAPVVQYSRDDIVATRPLVATLPVASHFPEVGATPLDTADERFSSLDARLETVRRTLCVSSIDLQQADYTNFTFFNPISVPDFQGCANTFITNKFMIFVCLFNLALAHHIDAMRPANTTSVSSPSRSFKTAAIMYELAYSLSVEDDLQIHPTFTLAILNNLAMIHNQIQETAKTHKCLHQLLMFVMLYASEWRENNRGATRFDERSLDGFLFNVQTLLLCDSQIAAPAA
jgi:hypothetical protein